MAKADRVHSTPPINSSSFPDDRDPPEARSESVDSFSQPTANRPSTGLRYRKSVADSYRVPRHGQRNPQSPPGPLLGGFFNVRRKASRKQIEPIDDKKQRDEQTDARERDDRPKRLHVDIDSRHARKSSCDSCHGNLQSRPIGEIAAPSPDRCEPVHIDG